MKYILKENVPVRKVSGVDRKTMKAIEAGKAFELDQLPTSLIHPQVASRFRYASTRVV